MTDEQAMFAILGGMILVISIVSAIVIILSVIGLWKCFTKMGDKGWKAIIPFYNLYTQIKHTWSIKYFWIILILSVLVGIVSSLSSLNGEDPVIWVLVISLVLSVILLILEIRMCYWLSKSFGHGGGWCALLVFFSAIMLLVLGFGSSRYVGNAYAMSKGQAGNY